MTLLNEKFCDRCGQVFRRKKGVSSISFAKRQSCSRACQSEKQRQYPDDPRVDRLRKAWRGMRLRCENPKNPKWPIYGGRGITVCDRWKAFANFFEDMGFPPDGYSLDRIDNSRGYSKGNCRWASPLTQTQNRRCTKMVNLGGEVMTVSECAARVGLPYNILIGRLRTGWTIERAVKTPPRAPRSRAKQAVSKGAGGQA